MRRSSSANPGAPDWIGPESVKVIVRTMRDAFPDFTEMIEDVVAEADRVVTRFTSTGTPPGRLAWRELLRRRRATALKQGALGSAAPQRAPDAEND